MSDVKAFGSFRINLQLGPFRKLSLGRECSRECIPGHSTEYFVAPLNLKIQ